MKTAQNTCMHTYTHILTEAQAHTRLAAQQKQFLWTEGFSVEVKLSLQTH